MTKSNQDKHLSFTPLIVAAVFAIAVSSIQANQVSANESSSKGNSTKLQARISFKTESLDFEENNQQPSDNEERITTTLTPSFNSTNDAIKNTTTTARPKQKRKSANKERSSRRLNNIWSLFLPGSSAGNENDYEDETTSATDESTGAAASPPATLVLGESKLAGGNSSSSLHDENMSLGDEQSSTSDGGGMLSESMLSSPSGAGQAIHLSSNQLPSSNNQTNNSAAINIRSDQQPVQLITGALSKDLSPNMNDIVSNIMSSMSSANESQSIRSPADSAGVTSLLDGGDSEREDDNRASVVLSQAGVSSNSSNGGESSFERWLSRIQFQDTTSATKAPTSTSTSTTPAPTSQQQKKMASAQANASTIAKTQQNPATGSLMLQQLTEFNRIADGLRAQSVKQQSAGNSITRQLQQRSKSQPPAVAYGTKTGSQSDSSYHHQKTGTSRLGTKGGHLQQELQSNEKKVAMNPIKSGYQQQRPQHSSNPLQQQLMRQQNSQLIHGIKFPSAQASTISVSTQDGSSNTSLSFATQNFGSPTSMSPFNEMSQVVNSSSGSSNAAGDQQDQVSKNNATTTAGMQHESVYQSQDEILRQVTSAINFDQQLQNKGIQSGVDSHNHRRPGEAISISPSLNLTDIDTTNSIANLFKTGTNFNDLVNPATTTSSPTNQAADNQKQESSPNRESGDIDKSFDFLARFVAQQQPSNTNGTNSNQPSWLRRPGDIVFGSNKQLSSIGGTENLAARLAASLAASGSRQSISADQVLELLSKHEKSKNELRHSQESMALLMQQLMQANNSLSNSGRQQQQTMRNNQPATTLIGDEQAVTVGGDNDHSNRQLSADSGGQQEQHSAGGQAPSNFGWTPVNRPANQLHQSQGAVPPISPAKLMKTRVKSAGTSSMKISQAGDNVGIGKDFIAAGGSSGGNKNSDDYYMNNLALMFASSQAANNEDNSQIELNTNDLQQGQQIFGLPIAILKEDEIELHQAQLEAAAAAAAEQLSQAGKTGGQLARHHFSPPRQQQQLDGSKVEGHRQQQQAGQINQIQKILENYSPQSFVHGLQPRAPISDPPQGANNAAAMQIDQRQQSQHQHQHPSSNDNLASLIHQDQGQLQEQGPFMNLLSTTNVLGGSNADDLVRPTQATSAGLSHQDNQHEGGTPAHNQRQSLKNLNKPSQQQQQRNQQSARNPEINRQQQKDEFGLHRQAQHRDQQQLIPGPGLVLTPSPYRVTGDLLPPGAGDGGFVHREPLITTTTITSGGPPMRVREVGLRRPFGFRSHHAIAYQPPAAVSAMFSPLSGHQAASRPSILRHMTPFRAVASTLGGGGNDQRFLAPLHLIPGPQQHQQQYDFASSEQLPFSSHQYLNHHHPLFGASFTTPMSVPIHHQHYVAAAARASEQLKRHSTPEIGWRNARMASSERLRRLHHLDIINAPLELDQSDENLIEEVGASADLEQQNIPEAIKYLALDQFNDYPTGIDALSELNAMQRHYDSLEVKNRKSRPVREQELPSPHRNLRARERQMQQQQEQHRYHRRQQHHPVQQPKQQLKNVASDNLVRIDQPSTKVTMKNPCPKTEIEIQSVAPTTTNAPTGGNSTTNLALNQPTTTDASSSTTIGPATTTIKSSAEEKADITTSLPLTNNNNNAPNVKPLLKNDDQPNSNQGDNKQTAVSNSTSNVTQFNVNATLMVS